MRRRALVIVAALAFALGVALPALAAPDPGGTVIATIPLGHPADSAVFGAGSFWVIEPLTDTIARIDAGTNALVARIPVGCCAEHNVAFGEGSLWVTNLHDNTVTRIDSATNTVAATIQSGGFLPLGLGVTPGAVWVTNHHADPNDPGSTGSVSRIDTATNTVVATIPVGAVLFCCGPQFVATTQDAVWVGVVNLNAVGRIDPLTNTIVATVKLKAARLRSERAEAWSPTERPSG